jgi:hypothetical protein
MHSNLPIHRSVMSIGLGCIKQHIDSCFRMKFIGYPRCTTYSEDVTPICVGPQYQLEDNYKDEHQIVSHDLHLRRLQISNLDETVHWCLNS